MSDIKNVLDNVEQGAKIVDSGLFLIEKILSHIPQYQEHQLYIDAINNNPDLSVPQKMVLTRSYGKYKKEIKNRFNIYRESVSILESNGQNIEEKFTEIDDEWFAIYDDIIKNISDETMQYTWAKILAGKCEDKKSVSKKTLLVLQYIEYDDAEIFSYLCSNVLMYRSIEDGDGETPIFLETSIGNVAEVFGEIPVKKIDVYDKNIINASSILRLKELGLITQATPFNSIVFAENIMIARYFDTQIQITSLSNTVEYGSIQFTLAGEELAKIIYDGLKGQKNNKLPQAVVEYYNSKGYEAKIKE